MKPIFTLLLSLLVVSFGYSLPTMSPLDKMLSVNQQWNDQKDIDPDQLPVIPEMEHRELIHRHLDLVEQYLRKRDVTHLSTRQQANRTAVLDMLAVYNDSRAYPVNVKYSYKTPIFIDDDGNYCAVGHLIRMTGYDGLAQDIRRSDNLIYIKDIRDKRFNLWAETYGFTIDELAWIQPGYEPTKKAKDVQGGTNQRVYKLFPKKNQLYFVGDFLSSGDDVPTQGIGFLEIEGDSEYEYRYLGTGVTGSVRAIIEYDDQLVLGGSMGYDDASFDQAVVYWNGVSWLPMGCLKGMAKELVSYDGGLYAVGDFQVCTEEGIAEGNFAFFNGENWQLIPGIEDSINTAIVFDEEIYLGGYFHIEGELYNIAKWHPEIGISTFPMDIIQEINDFEIAWNRLHAAGRQRDETDISYLLMTLEDGIWTPVVHTLLMEESALQKIYDLPINIASIRFMNDKLYGVGDLRIFQGVGNDCSHNFMLYEDGGSYTCMDFEVDSTIRDITIWDDRFFICGDFTYSYGNSANRLAYITSMSSGIDNLSPIQLSVYPNPATYQLYIQGLNSNAEAKIYNILAQEVWSGILESSGLSVDVSNIMPGNYLLVVQDKNGNSARSKVTIMR